MDARPPGEADGPQVKDSTADEAGFKSQVDKAEDRGEATKKKRRARRPGTIGFSKLSRRALTAGLTGFPTSRASRSRPRWMPMWTRRTTSCPAEPEAVTPEVIETIAPEPEQCAELPEDRGPSAPQAQDTLILDQPAPAMEGPLQDKLPKSAPRRTKPARPLRATAALHEGLSAAYDFALDAETSPEEYLRLVEAQGLKIQLRAPMAPVAKLAFDGLVDPATLGQCEEDTCLGAQGRVAARRAARADRPGGRDFGAGRAKCASRLQGLALLRRLQPQPFDHRIFGALPRNVGEDGDIVFARLPRQPMGPAGDAAQLLDFLHRDLAVLLDQPLEHRLVERVSNSRPMNSSQCHATRPRWPSSPGRLSHTQLSSATTVEQAIRQPWVDMSITRASALRLPSRMVAFKCSAVRAERLRSGCWIGTVTVIHSTPAAILRRQM